MDNEELINSNLSSCNSGVKFNLSELRRWYRNAKIIRIVIQSFHFVIVFAFTVIGIIEFVHERPFFDALTQHQLPEQLFQREFLRWEASLKRFMDIPILIFFLFYFGVCSWYRFAGIQSWLLTISLSATAVIYFDINLWDRRNFDWKYFDSRFNGILIQVYVVSLNIALVLTIFLTKRKRLPFKFKRHFPLYRYGSVHIAWNFIALSIVTSTCLLFWVSKLYISWVCVDSLYQISYLCQVTPVVQCYLCDKCIDSELKICAANTSNLPIHCYNPISTFIANKSAFCTFNYNIGILTFITVFAYVGGLWVFLHAFLSSSIHYSITFGFYVWRKCCGQGRNRFGVMFESTNSQFNYRKASLEESNAAVNLLNSNDDESQSTGRHDSSATNNDDEEKELTVNHIKESTNKIGTDV